MVTSEIELSKSVFWKSNSLFSSYLKLDRIFFKSSSSTARKKCVFFNQAILGNELKQIGLYLPLE